MCLCTTQEQASAISQLSEIARRQKAWIAAARAERGELARRASLHDPEEVACLRGLVGELSGFKASHGHSPTASPASRVSGCAHCGAMVSLVQADLEFS